MTHDKPTERPEIYDIIYPWRSVLVPTMPSTLRRRSRYGNWRRRSHDYADGLPPPINLKVLKGLRTTE